MQSFPLYTLLWSFLWTSEHHLCTYSLSEQVTLGLRYNLDLGDICECPAFCPTWYWSAISLSVDRISLSWHLHLHRFFLTYASNRWFWNFHTADVNFWGVAMTHFLVYFRQGNSSEGKRFSDREQNAARLLWENHPLASAMPCEAPREWSPGLKLACSLSTWWLKGLLPWHSSSGGTLSVPQW